MEIKLRVHISFYLFLFFVIYFSGFSLFLSYFIALFLHEYSHHFMSERYGYKAERICIFPFGMNVNVNNHYRNDKACILIYFIGPFVNIILLLITMSLWWLFPVVYFYTKEFAIANVCLGFFNLIPIYPLDGGNIILQFFKTYNSKCRALKVMKIFAIIFAILFMFLFAISCFSSLNFSCLCISIFLFSSIFTYNDILDNEIKKRCDFGIRESKIYVIKPTTKFNEIKKCFDDSKFVQFYLLNDNNRIVKIITQDEMVLLFNKNSLEEKINIFNNRLES